MYNYTQTIMHQPTMNGLLVLNFLQFYIIQLTATPYITANFYAQLNSLKKVKTFDHTTLETIDSRGILTCVMLYFSMGLLKLITGSERLTQPCRLFYIS